MNMARVTIILLNYKGWKDTLECLESILKTNYANLKIIVVDNASPDNSMDYIQQWADGKIKSDVKNEALNYLSYPSAKKPIKYRMLASSNLKVSELDSARDDQVVFIQSKTNGGFAAGNNIGIKHAIECLESDYIWLLNNDTVIEPNTLLELVNKSVEYKEQGQKVGIIGSKLMHYYQHNKIQAVAGIYNPSSFSSRHLGDMEEDLGQYDYDLSQDAKIGVKYPVGASMFVDSRFVKEVGLMCEDYFLYFEELDWVYRGILQNWKFGYCWRSRVYHKEGASIGSDSNAKLKSEISDFYGVRNKLLFLYKFHKRLIPLFYLTLPIVIAKRIRRNQSSRISYIIKIYTTKPSKLKNLIYKN